MDNKYKKSILARVMRFLVGFEKSPFCHTKVKKIRYKREYEGIVLVISANNDVSLYFDKEIWDTTSPVVFTKSLSKPSLDELNLGSITLSVYFNGANWNQLFQESQELLIRKEDNDD